MSGTCRGDRAGFYLCHPVAARSRPVPRDELADAIWGESPPPTWEKALAVIVSKLRGLLADDGVVLTHAFGCYRLDLPDGAWVDITAAAEAAEEAEHALEAGELDEARAAAEPAESLARAPFLPGEDGVWVVQKRRELADIRVRAVSVLAEACLCSGAGERRRSGPRSWSRSRRFASRLPAPDGSPRRRRQPGRGVAGLRALPPAPRR